MINQAKLKKAEFIDIIRNAAKDGQSLNDFCEAILSDAEFETLSIRMEMFKQLIAGIGQREVAKDLGAGIETVNRAAKAIRDYPIIKKLIKL